MSPAVIERSTRAREPRGMRVIIVGAGVLGTMHAWQALSRGHEVVHIEREAAARGASVRNFGLVWVSGRSSGPELQTALRARELWDDRDRHTGRSALSHGSCRGRWPAYAVRVR